MPSVFVTGATGFLGTYVIEQLLESTQLRVYALVRADGRDNAERRLRNLWWTLPPLRDQLGQRIVPIAGDITADGLGLDPHDRDAIQQDCTYVIHTAAQVQILKSRDEMQAVNVQGTRNVLDFAQQLDAIRPLTRFAFVSTAYVAGTLEGRIPAGQLPPHDYNSLYEQSKHQAEQLVRASSLPVTIFRPGMIVGHSQTGRITNFNTVYYVLKLLLTDKVRVLPVSAGQRVNITPVDYVAQTLVHLLMRQDTAGQTFHLTTPTSQQPTIGQLVEFVRTWSSEHLRHHLKRPLFMPMPWLKKRGAAFNANTAEKQRGQQNNLLALMPYFFDACDFDTHNVQQHGGGEAPNWRDYLGVLLDYACRKNFLHENTRTVFEQAQFRRKSKSMPITYHDVSAQGITDVTASQISQLSAQVHAALVDIGFRPGDRIAIAGINCTQYLALDTGMGLAGAVSVPIYYTTPAAEIDALLQASHAIMLFVGDKRIMSNIDKVTTHIPIVAFANALDALDAQPNPGSIVTWDAFLSHGAGKSCEPAPVSYGDLATIRYTSGTTGAPKGVTFNHYQLRWMGEVLACLLDWKGRNSQMRYLSFLPMSHVVEGILATYAPYYMHAKSDVYYLNDFDSLVQSLPKIRPTVFFSVPRFYEKVWEQFCANPAGQRYLSMQDGPAKRALGAIARNKLLKTAGLDACEQLIVGSAPVSRQLLENFRGLGIEIHNAYGQTEAPLITICRTGDNQFGTVGTALPDTQLSIEDDEIIVRGPQVTLGYDGMDSSNVRDGVLRTGDLGTLDQGGHLAIIGRKKEMLITSYGKNINMQKVETALKNIPYVDEAVLIGEGRPYCSALLWLSQDADASNLAADIEVANQELSHPEQVKRWTVIEQPLAISKGELTPNLKVRHAVVEQHYQSQVEAMYAATAVSTGNAGNAVSADSVASTVNAAVAADTTNEETDA